MADRRWLRLDAGWQDSEWVADLSCGGRLAWVSLLGHVKVAGVRGQVRALAPSVAGRRWDIPAEDVAAMLAAAQADGALVIEDGDWIVTGWARYQEPDPSNAERKRRWRGEAAPEQVRTVPEDDHCDDERTGTRAERTGTDGTRTARTGTRGQGVPRRVTVTVTGTEQHTHNAHARGEPPDSTAEPPPPPPAPSAPPPPPPTSRGYDARALRAWERWLELKLPLPESVPEHEHLERLTVLFTGPKTWRPSQVNEAQDRIAADLDRWAWVAREGPGYLAHRPRGRPQVIEQVLTNVDRPDARRQPTIEERVAKIVANSQTGATP